ncbi:MAG TPA: 50S ribosomal protein L4 [Anaerolineales bacterium]|nr:50S ribosomal protein L4 [Anaerolineales bacterium]
MEVEVKDLAGAKVGTVELPADIFEAPINKDLMHQALVRQQTNARLGTHETKGRGEVRGGGKKPFKQKGTGRARQGSTRAPHWKGGGKAHTPHMHAYTLDMPRQMRRSALRSALSTKASEGQIVVVDNFSFDAPKTKSAVSALKAIGVGRTALIVLPEHDGVAQKSVNNMPTAKTLNARYLNVRDLLGYETLVLPLAALDVIKSLLGTEVAA